MDILGKRGNSGKKDKSGMGKSGVNSKKGLIVGRR